MRVCTRLRSPLGGEPADPAATVDPVVESVALVQPVDPRNSTCTGKNTGAEPKGPVATVDTIVESWKAV